MTCFVLEGKLCRLAALNKFCVFIFCYGSLAKRLLGLLSSPDGCFYLAEHKSTLGPTLWSSSERLAGMLHGLASSSWPQDPIILILLCRMWLHED